MDKTKKLPRGIVKYYIRVVFPIAFFTVLMMIIFFLLYNVSKENVLNIGHLNAEQIEQELRYYLVEELDEIELVAKTLEVMQDMGKTNEEILDYLTFESRIVGETINENYTGIYGYINGVYMDGSGWTPDPDFDPEQRPWYISAMENNGKVTYVTPYVDADTGTVMMSIAKMLPDRKSVVSLDVAPIRIQSIVESSTYKEYDQVIVADKNNIVISAQDRSIRGADISEDPIIAGFNAMTGNANSCYDYRSVSGVKYVVFTANVADQWNVFLVQKSGTLMRSLYNIYAILIAGTITFFVIVLITFYYLNRRRKAAEALNTQLESIADIYVSMHRFDIERDHLEEIRSMPFVREQQRIAEQTSSGAIEILRKVMKALILEEYWDEMTSFTDPNTLGIRTGGSNSISAELLSRFGWIKARIIILERKHDKVTKFLWLIESIEEEKRKQSELRYLSETDLMTGLRNRGCGERLVKEQIENDVSGMFCLMDVDHFKSINDTYGHAAGDAVLKALANCMKGAFAANDIVLRLGGDEFAAYVVGVEDEYHAKGVLNRFIGMAEQADIPAFGGKQKIEISIGATFVSPGCGKDFESVYREADKAAYRSKKTEGSTMSFYDAELDR